MDHFAAALQKRRMGYGTHFHFFHAPSSWMKRGVGGDESESSSSMCVVAASSALPPASGIGESGWSFTVLVVALSWRSTS